MQQRSRRSRLNTPPCMTRRRALSWLAEYGDILTVDGESWLLAPAPAALVDLLAVIDADTDLEPEPAEHSEVPARSDWCIRL